MTQASATSDVTGTDREYKSSANMDIEQQAMAEAHLKNTTVRDFSWQGVTVTVKDRVTKQPKTLVENAQGVVEAGRETNSPYSI